MCQSQTTPKCTIRSQKIKKKSDPCRSPNILVSPRGRKKDVAEAPGRSQ